jgi:hypothetical protein
MHIVKPDLTQARTRVAGESVPLCNECKAFNVFLMEFDITEGQVGRLCRDCIRKALIMIEAEHNKI